MLGVRCAQYSAGRSHQPPRLIAILSDKLTIRVENDVFFKHVSLAIAGSLDLYFKHHDPLVLRSLDAGDSGEGFRSEVNQCHAHVCANGLFTFDELAARVANLQVDSAPHE